jgi:hypothetical protein
MKSRTGIKLHHNSIDTIKHLELYDNRFINCCLLGEDQGVLFKKERYYPVDVDEYAKSCKLRLHEAFESVIDVIRKLKETSMDITLPDGSVYVTSLIYDFIYNESEKQILINWNSKFIPLISGHMEAGNFLLVDPRISTISSSKRYSLYILIEKNLWQLTRHGKFILTKEEIRTMLNLEETEYKEFKSLHAKIIKPTLTDIYNKLGIKLVSSVRANKVIFNYGER